MPKVRALNLMLLLSTPPGKSISKATSSDVMKLDVACAVEATKEVHAAHVQHPVTNPTRRPYLGPAAAAAHKYIDPDSGMAEQISASDAAVMIVPTHVTIQELHSAANPPLYIPV